MDYFDRHVIDRSINGLSNAVISGGDLLSKAQNGNVHTYAGVVVGGIVALFVVAIVFVYIFGGL